MWTQAKKEAERMQMSSKENKKAAGNLVAVKPSDLLLFADIIFS